jgi:malonate decarboxylase epsilon subunit
MSVLFAFPGQGVQRPGMLHELPDEPSVRACLDIATEVLGEPVLALDNREALTSTRAVQLCLLVAGVAAASLLPAPDFVAGLSIGAYPAAVVAGALSFADALRLVSLRGELMQQAFPAGFGMTAILGLEQGQLQPLIDAVHSSHAPVYLANINAERQLVIAGSDAAMQAVARLARQQGAALARRLAVSVPSHCALLEQAGERLAAAFAQIALHRPRLRYLSASIARPIVHPDALRDDLAWNLCRVVDWRGVIQHAYERGVRLHLELPPGTVLSGLARPLFGSGAVAFQSARRDSLLGLIEEEGRRTP